MYKQILIFLCLVCSCFPLWGQEHQWYEPFFINVDLGGDARAEMKVDNLGNTYLMVLFEDEVTILDTTLYTSKDNGVLVAKLDANHNLEWVKIIAEAHGENPNQSRVIDNLSLEIDKENQMLYPVVEYTDSTYLDGQLYTVIQTETYHRDIVVFEMNLQGSIQDTYHFQGSCQTGYGGVKIKGEYLYFHIFNLRNNLDADSVCSCFINSDTTIYSENKNAILGRIEKSTGQLDWIEVYNVHASSVIGSRIGITETDLYISGRVESAADLVFQEDSLIVPNIYSRYGYIARFSLDGSYKWSKYFGVKGWDSRAVVRDLEVNTSNDIVVVIDLLTQSVSNQLFFENAPTLTGVGNNDESFVVVNYDSLGNVKWHDISNSIGYERMISVDFDSHKNMYLAGSFTTDITFGNQFIDGYGFSSDILIISYDSLGNKRWAQKAGGNGGESAGYMSIDSSDVLHVGGFITASSATFGVHETTPPSPGNSIFVAQMKLEPIGLNETTPQQFGVSVYPNPSAGQTQIQVQDEFISHVTIYNGFGQEIKTLNFDNQTDNVSVENLPSGYYILDIHVESGKHVAQKLIVK